MVKGEESKIRILIRPGRVVTGYMDVLEALFVISKKSEESNINLHQVADKILTKISQRGEQGLESSDWENYYKELNVTQAQYFYILRRLKESKMIYKSKGKFYISRGFADTLTELASALNKYMMRLGK